MAYVTVPKDLSKVKNKVVFNLTRRQLILFREPCQVLFFTRDDFFGEGE